MYAREVRTFFLGRIRRVRAVVFRCYEGAHQARPAGGCTRLCFHPGRGLDATSPGEFLLQYCRSRMRCGIRDCRQMGSARNGINAAPRWSIEHSARGSPAMWSDCRHRDCAKVRWRGLPSPVEQILAIRSLGPTTRIHLAITIFLATRICARQPSCSVGGRIALCSGPRPQPFADDPIFFGRIALLRILPAVAELISAGNHSRNPRTHHRRQPAGQMASPYACGDRIFDAALMRARSINHEGHEGRSEAISRDRLVRSPFLRVFCGLCSHFVSTPNPRITLTSTLSSPRRAGLNLQSGRAERTFVEKS